MFNSKPLNYQRVQFQKPPLGMVHDAAVVPENTACLKRISQLMDYDNPQYILRRKKKRTHQPTIIYQLYQLYPRLYPQTLMVKNHVSRSPWLSRGHLRTAGLGTRGRQARKQKKASSMEGRAPDFRRQAVAERQRICIYIYIYIY